MKKILLSLSLVILIGFGWYIHFKILQPKKGASLLIANSSVVESAKDGTIASVILPHLETETTKTQRRELLSTVADKISPQRIIIASVNHEGLGQGNVLVYPSNWQLQSGELKLDKQLSDGLVSSGLALSDSNSFLDENGIKNVVDDLYLDFPKALYTTIIIKDTTSVDETNKLSDYFETNCRNCLFVGSVDFSHYNQRGLANVHDRYSLSALENLDFAKIWQAETDSPQVLTLAAQFAKANSETNFHLTTHGNSADLDQSDDTETTSYIMGYYDKTPVSVAIKSTSFVIAGDVMFDRMVWHNFKDLGLNSIFSNFGTRVFRGDDIALLNNEGPISATPIDDRYLDDSLVFNFPPIVPSVEKYIGIKAVSLANNHTLNAGAVGFATTKKMLSAAGIDNFGQQAGFDPISDIYRVDAGVPVSIIGVDALSTFSEPDFEAAIKKEKSAGRFVLVFPHWGTEYKTTHDANQKRTAKAWIAAGADMIIGSHPHVVEDFEIIDGAPVVYSLGNFVFDQTFSSETQHGLIVGGIISDAKITLTFQPTREVKIKPEILHGTEKTTALSSIFNIDAQDGFTRISSDTIEIPRK